MLFIISLHNKPAQTSITRCEVVLLFVVFRWLVPFWNYPLLMIGVLSGSTAF